MEVADSLVMSIFKQLLAALSGFVHKVDFYWRDYRGPTLQELLYYVKYSL